MTDEPTWEEQINAIRNLPFDEQREVVERLLPEVITVFDRIIGSVIRLVGELNFVAGLSFASVTRLQKGLVGVDDTIQDNLSELHDAMHTFRQKAPSYSGVLDQFNKVIDIANATLQGIERVREDKGANLRQTAGELRLALKDVAESYALSSKGGRPRQAVLNRLYDVAIPFYQELGHEWVEIANRVDRVIHSTNDQELIQLWSNIHPLQRGERLRKIFGTRQKSG